MDNGMEQYYGAQPLYMDGSQVYAEDYYYSYADTPPVPQEPEQPALELPEEPEDSPYEDPIVRHILTVKDDKYRRRMLSYLNENARVRRDLHPAFVMLALVFFFPVGLCMMYFGTRWGTFAKVVITVFTLVMALCVYEILVYSGTLPTPSLIETIVYIFSQIF